MRNDKKSMKPITDSLTPISSPQICQRKKDVNEMTNVYDHVYVAMIIIRDTCTQKSPGSYYYYKIYKKRQTSYKYYKIKYYREQL